MSSTGVGSRKRKEPTRRSERIKQLKAKSETQFPHVPEEILVTILSKLPVKSLLQFRFVSKHWSSLITDPKFNLSTPKQQVIVVSKYYASPDCFLHLINDEALSVEVPKPKQLKVRDTMLHRLTIQGSCNGLVLLSNTMNLFLWNPSTRCCRKVLSHAHLATFGRSINASGLCYDSSTDDYKVVMACWLPKQERDDDKVMVGSLRNIKTWTEVCFPYDKRCVKSGPTVNERLHWLVTKSTSSMDETNFLVAGFDSRTNEFVKVPMPQSKKGKPILSLGALDGCLSLALSTDCRRLDESEVEVFIMKKYCDQASWTSLFVISNVPHSSSSRIWVPLCLTKNAEVLMQLESSHTRRILVYNRENFCRDIPFGTTNFLHNSKASTFVESLVSPPNNNWEEEEEYTETFLSGVTKKWKCEQGDVAFKVIDS